MNYDTITFIKKSFDLQIQIYSVHGYVFECPEYLIVCRVLVLLGLSRWFYIAHSSTPASV